MMLGYKYALRSSLFCNCRHSSVTSSLLGPDIHFSSLLLNTENNVRSETELRFVAEEAFTLWQLRYAIEDPVHKFN
jgi:hypothetical protein